VPVATLLISFASTEFRDATNKSASCRHYTNLTQLTFSIMLRLIIKEECSMGRNGRQSGFSAVFGVLAVLIIVGLGVAGWAVYQHNRVKPTSAASSSGQSAHQQTTTTTTTTPPPSASNQNVVKIPELGIQITVPDDIKDLTYQTQVVTLRNGNQSTLAMFSTKALTAVDAKCGPAAMPLGSLGKASGQYPTQQQDASNVLDYGQLVKQFSTFYIAAGYPQAACSLSGSAGSDTAAANNNKLANTDKATFEAAFSTIQSLN